MAPYGRLLATQLCLLLTGGEEIAREHRVPCRHSIYRLDDDFPDTSGKYFGLKR